MANYRYLIRWMVLAVVAGTWGAALASGGGDLDKRVEAFKSGIAEHGEAGKAEAGHAAPAAATEVKHESGKPKHESGKPKHKAKQVKKAGHPAPGNAAHASSGHQEGMEPEEALKMLLDGNKRYVAEKAAGPHRSSQRRADVAKGQHPFAVIVSCSDSRVPPELLFDQGFGDLFVVRTAGNVVDSVALGSIEYAVDHLGTKLIMVLGHERCGAVDATVKGGEAPSHVKTVVEAIKPAVDRAKAKGTGGHGCDLVCNSVKANIKLVAEKMRTSPILAELMDDGMLKVVGAYYDLESGITSLTYKPYL